MLQKITIIGYLGRDPEMRYLDTGIAVCNFSVATSRKYNRKDGTPVDETAWFAVTVWGTQAENAYKYLEQGNPVYVEGRLRPDEQGNPRSFQRNDGSFGSKYEVTATDVRYLPSGGEKTQAVDKSYQQYKEDDKPPFMPTNDDGDDEFIY